ncbi:MAG: hypothetical protein HKO70_01800 [Acidimicrobiia bacterium]|nr:hypothetical protein [Acidimicrobiia bacterium]
MRRFAIVFLAALTMATLAVPAGASHSRADRLTAMTQNLYVGTDLFELLVPVPECADFDALGIPCSVIVQGGRALDDVAATNYPERAAKIADLIAVRRPDILGLQEVSRVTVIPADPLGNPVGEPVVTDYLQILLDELAARGLEYQVAASVDNADIFPVPTGVLTPQGPAIQNLVGLLDRDVILARPGVKVHADTAMGARFDSAQLSFPLAGQDVEFTRSYVKVDVTVRGRRYAAVNTHLEVEFGPASGPPLYPAANAIQAAQAGELAKILSVEDDPIVLLGDFNSAPDSDNGLEGVPTPYQILAGSGFSDVWNLRSFGSSPGYTCCQAELLDNPVSDLDERIDQIWLGPGLETRWVFANTVGDRRWQKTPSGLWPSDHAGVIGYLGLKR